MCMQWCQASCCTVSAGRVKFFINPGNSNAIYTYVCIQVSQTECKTYTSHSEGFRATDVK